MCASETADYSKYLYVFMLMASLTVQNFDGSTGFNDSYDTIQSEAGNVTWCNEFVPSGVDLLPRFCYGHAILWESVAQLAACMLCIQVVK